MDMSEADQLITRAIDEHNEWLNVDFDDYRRFSDVPVKAPLFGILMMIFGFILGPLNDGDASITKPLPEQLYIGLAGLGVFLFSLILIKLQYKEIRWIKNERTFIIFNKGIGSHYLKMVYHVEDGDKLSLDQETLGHWKDSPDGESEYKTKTTYWLNIERSNGILVETTYGDNVLSGSKNQISEIRNFILSHS
mgnify:FL=1